MAPEQAEGREVGPEADLYSLALVLYEALTGVNPQEESRRRAAPAHSCRRCAVSAATSAAAWPPASTRRCARGRTSVAACSICARRCSTRSTRSTTRPASSRPAGAGARTTPGSRTARARVARAATTLPACVCGARGSLPDAGAAGAGSCFSPARSAASVWLPRAANAAGAGLGAAWLSTHLWHHPPLTPAVVGLAVAVIALLLPLVGSLLTAIALGRRVARGRAARRGGAARRPLVAARLFAAAGLCVLIGVARATPPRPLLAAGSDPAAAHAAGAGRDRRLGGGRCRPAAFARPTLPDAGSDARRRLVGRRW